MPVIFADGRVKYVKGVLKDGRTRIRIMFKKGVSTKQIYRIDKSILASLKAIYGKGKKTR